jgi:hypothetical protein
MLNNNNSKTKLGGLSLQANYTDRATPIVGKVSVNFRGQRVSRDQRNGSLAVFSIF